MNLSTEERVKWNAAQLKISVYKENLKSSIAEDLHDFYRQ